MEPQILAPQNLALKIRPLLPRDAAEAAGIHTEGQPGTFLTSLGPAFLRAMYGQMAVSPHCYGYVACEGDEVVGVVVGTVDSGAVFKELIWRRGIQLALPVVRAWLRQPSLLSKIWQTLSYPSQSETTAGEAELYFIGVRGDRRSKGVGRSLFQALAQESQRRGMLAMGLMADATNEAAQRLYRLSGMQEVRRFTLYGRSMIWYRLPLSGARPAATEENPVVA